MYIYISIYMYICVYIYIYICTRAIETTAGPSHTQRGLYTILVYFDSFFAYEPILIFANTVSNTVSNATFKHPLYCGTAPPSVLPAISRNVSPPCTVLPYNVQYW